jgi:putative spermidine/putrescine transport system ATP-binding protein
MVAEHLKSAAGAIKLERLSKSFGQLRVVQDVSLDIASGEIVALLGASGCGKTTTLRMIAGLITPDEGRISIAGQVVNDVPVERRDVGLLFQSYALFPHMTVLGNVLFGLRTWQRRTPRAQAREAALEALRLVRLEGYEGRYPAALSGGQQQRVALARALVTEPRVLLLDEPLSALDKNLRAAMQSELRTLISRLGLTTVLVTHDQEEAMTVADRIAVMDGGRIVQVGTAADLYERPRTKFVADFVGTTNLFSGTIEDGADGQMILAVGNGARLGLPAASDRDGQHGIVAVRPERISVGAPSACSGLNAVEGVIESFAYKGTTVSLALRLADGALLQVAVLNSGKSDIIFSKGQAVAASWDNEANVLLEE